jgi:Ca-activated chloride channel homolog
MKNIIFKIIIIIILLNQSVFSQIIITGRVINKKDSLPIVGATVAVKGTVIGTVTDSNGKYSLSVPKESKTLVFYFIGMISVEIPINGNVINVALEEASMNVNDVVVIGYGSQKRLDVTGSSVYSIPQNALNGRRSNNSIMIRGNRSNTNLTYFNPSLEEYNKIRENGFKPAKNEPLSTFSIDVDRASYSNIRRFINMGQKVPEDAVKIEEMINYLIISMIIKTLNIPIQSTQHMQNVRGIRITNFCI